jgi:hypothetical protein
MPLLDPSTDVIGDPNLFDLFNVRRQVVQMEAGRTKHVDELIEAQSGIIGPVGYNRNTRTKSSARSVSNWLVITRFRLRKQAAGILPDIVLYADMELLVVDVNDYARFGPGWVEATCSNELVQPSKTGAL